MTDWSAIRLARELGASRVAKVKTRPTGPLEMVALGHEAKSLRQICTIGVGATSVFVAVFNGATTYTEVMDETGFNRSTVHGHVHRLQSAGLVTQEPGKHGTLRATVTEVPVG